MKNPITLEALQVIDTIDRRGSFAKAAEELNKVPSALSYIVQKLEEQLGVTLFQRVGRKSQLTPAGQVLLEDGREILLATDQLIERTRETDTGWEPKLRIALEGVLEHELVFPVFQAFLEEHPQIELDIQEVILGGGWEALESDQIHLLIGVPNLSNHQASNNQNSQYQRQGIRVETMKHSAEMVMAASPSLPITKEEPPISLDNHVLKHTRKVVVHDSSIHGIRHSVGLLEGNQVFYVQTLEQKISAQLAGIGIGQLPKRRIQQYLGSGKLVEIKFKNEENENKIKTETPLLLAWKVNHKGKALKKLSQMLLAKLGSNN